MLQPPAAEIEEVRTVPASTRIFVLFVVLELQRRW
jgi:hypothetical protein